MKLTFRKHLKKINKNYEKYKKKLRKLNDEEI